jgi:uncharacterized protein YktB (UPF0637 family)
MLFDEPTRFEGFDAADFEVFSIAHREERRRAILDAFHPALEALGKEAVRRFGPREHGSLHPHLPQLNWPPGYQPFCTWLALSFEAHGYLDGPQLNLGVHADHVAVRLGWDTRPAAFGRFEFLSRHGGLDRTLRELCETASMRLRVYATARWPQGSRLTFESADDVAGSFDEVARRGVWWEIGRRYDLEKEAARLAAPAFGEEALETFEALMPLYERIVGHAYRDDK